MCIRDSARAWCELHAVDAEPKARGEVAKQPERVARFDDEQPRPVDGGDLVEQVVEGRGFPEPVGPNKNRCAFI